MASFGCGETAPGEARRWLASVLDLWQIYARRNDVLLLLSELVNNAVCHGLTDVDVAVTSPASETSPATLHVEVFDDGTGRPVLLDDATSASEHGRGLHLVDTIADRWGYREVPLGKAVWFDLIL